LRKKVLSYSLDLTPTDNTEAMTKISPIRTFPIQEPIY